MGFKAAPAAAPVYTPPNLAPKLDWLNTNLASGVWGKLGVTPVLSECHFHPPVGDKALFTPLAAISTGVRQLQLLDFSHLTLAVAPANLGGSMPTVVATSRYFYIPQGFSASGTRGSGFYRYDIILDSWATMAAITTLASGYRFNYDNGCLWDGGDFIYVLGGYDAASDKALFRYSISGDSWAELADLPDTYAGGGLCEGPIGDFIYALRGTNTTTFWRYSISGDSWSTLAAYDINTGKGGLYEDPEDADLLYAVTAQVAGARTRRYSISGDAWTTLTNTNQPTTDLTKGLFITSPSRMLLMVLRNGTAIWVYKV